jgi:hypothetical protein
VTTADIGEHHTTDPDERTIQSSTRISVIVEPTSPDRGGVRFSRTASWQR